MSVNAMDTPQSSTRFTPGHGHARHEFTPLPERNLDILRASALTLVVLSQILGFREGYDALEIWLMQAGICAFILHSSLVLMGALERDGAPTRPGWIGRLYVRRAFRIYPLVWLLIAVVSALHIPATVHGVWEPASPVQLLTNLLLVTDVALKQPIVPLLWAVPLAVQVSLVIPLCYVITRARSTKPLIILLVAGVGLALLGVFGAENAHALPGVKRLLLLRWIAGVLVGAIAYRMLRVRNRGALLPWWMWFPIIVAGVVLGGVLYPVSSGLLARTAFCALLGLTLPLLADAPKSPITRMTRAIAVHSYAAYLFLTVTIYAAFEGLATLPFAAKTALATVILVVLSVLAHRLVERPGIALGRRLLGLRAK